jgi:DNA invertase Pin-like site-specific DNA recombinase
MGRPKRWKDAIAYRRVSTDKQGASGVGLEGQWAAITAYAEADRHQLKHEYHDIASGRGEHNLLKRPGLQAAIGRAISDGIPIIVSGLDRISRETSTVNEIVSKYGVTIISARDGKLHNPVIIAAKAARAQREGELIAQRTREALARKKAEGVQLGNRKNLPEAQRLGRESRIRKANETVLKIVSVLETLPEDVAARELADILNQRGIRTSRNLPWTISAIRRPRREAQAYICSRKSEGLKEMYKDNPEFGTF